VFTCSACGEENPDRARFCLNCSAPLQPAVSRHERKFATALFADIVGSTALAEREDPEVVQALVGRAFDRLSAEIERYGGLIEKFVGDAVLAVFGVPSAHEDDPERAVRAGLEMQAVLSELNRSFAAEGRPELEMRIGVEAGEVLVDLERAGGARDRMLTGVAVNPRPGSSRRPSPGTSLSDRPCTRTRRRSSTTAISRRSSSRARPCPSRLGPRSGSGPAGGASGRRSGSRRAWWAGTRSSPS
jgi:hypothetical protein